MPPRVHFANSGSLRSVLNPVSCSGKPTVSALRQHSLPRNKIVSLAVFRHYAFGSPRRPQYNRFTNARILFRTSLPFRYTTIALGSGFAIFIVSNIEKVPESGRWRFNCVSEAFERRNGDMTYNMIMRQYQGHLIKSTDPRCKMVGRVLTRLVEGGELKGDWEYHVIDGQEPNAFVIPG